MSSAPSEPLALSVIITSHDYERYVGEAIASALDQHGAAGEVIVVDDGSTDGSRERDRVLRRAHDGDLHGQPRAGRRAEHRLRSEQRRGGAVPRRRRPAAAEARPRACARRCADTAVAKVHWSMPVVDADGRRTGEIQDPELAEGDLRRAFFERGPLSDGDDAQPARLGERLRRAGSWRR